MPNANPDFFSELPNELILRIFEHFQFPELLTARRVCPRWRALVPFTHMGRTRREMLDFLLNHLQTSPWFLRTRPWVKANLAQTKSKFDRRAYIDKLQRQYPSLPESFTIWVLEWPERAVIAGLWPGLQRRRYFPPFSDDINVREGVSWLTYPQVSVMTFLDHETRVAEHVPGILAWRSREAAVWIVVDERERLSGKVFSSASCKSDLESAVDGDVDEGEGEGGDTDVHKPKLKLRKASDQLDSTWIAFLRRVWKSVEAKAEAEAARLAIPKATQSAGLILLDTSIFWPQSSTSRARPDLVWTKTKTETETSTETRTLALPPTNDSPSAYPDISEMGETAWVRRYDARCQQRLAFLNSSHFD